VTHLVYIVMDSARFDAVEAARTPNLDRIGPLRRRYSYASWTAPSHLTMFMGLVPHASPTGVFASEVYKGEYAAWGERLNLPDLDFAAFLPALSLPALLARHGYRTTALVSLPVLNPHTVVARDFERYELWPSHQDFAGMIGTVGFDRGAPEFLFFNLGETHYPYMLDDAALPRISGVHGVAKSMAARRTGDDPPGAAAGGDFFDVAELDRLRRQQIRCVEYLDGLIGEFMARCPADTHIIVTADHGELFGEDGYFGHGPIMHRKVFEVPFIEGRVPR
jgi:hypothetical protein